MYENQRFMRKHPQNGYNGQFWVGRASPRTATDRTKPVRTEIFVVTHFVKTPAPSGAASVASVCDRRPKSALTQRRYKCDAAPTELKNTLVAGTGGVTVLAAMKMLLGNWKVSGLKLIKFVILLALLATARLTLAQVTNLGIAPVGGQSLLYWPISSTNYLLQTTSDLATPNWATASNAVAVNAMVVTNSAPVGYFRLLAQTNTTAGMVLIPAGSFLMGNYLFYNSPTNDPDIGNANPTNIYVSAFYMETNLVSYSQWQAIYGYATNHGYAFYQSTAVSSYVAGGKAANHPVQTVDWFDCVKWCNARSQQTGLTPVYYTDAGFAQVYTNGDTGTTVYQNLTNNGYRLPTQAEWEKAARGGLSGLRFPWGNSISENQANYKGDTASYSYDLGPNGYNALGNYPATTPGTTPVGSFAPNGYGLYDMAGNVFEWCWDWAGGTYGQQTTNNPTGPTGSTFYRVFRGGTWLWGANNARCAASSWAAPDFAYYGFGFRCVRGL
jgi:formylglycine-generating enzyme required for sulfatase activity